MKYQLIALGPSADQYLPALKAEFTERISDIGLDPASDIEIIEVPEKANIDWKGTPVGVWFGGTEGPDPDERQLLATILKNSAPVFPVVSDLQRYRELTPSELHAINGQQWNVAGPGTDSEGCDRLVANLLSAFRLTRGQRHAFISYKRAESRGVAVQLFDALSQRNYRPFLDTASIDAGVDFQEALWGRMADTDLLIFLDSPQALTSRWVHQELARAQALGLGVLQILWPKHQRTPGTEFSDCVDLQLTDFQSQIAGPDGVLTAQAMTTIVSAAESARIRSLAARRVRVVSELVSQASEHGFEVVVSPVGPVVLNRSGQLVCKVIPLVGLPDAPAIEEAGKSIGDLPAVPVRIVYNGLGMSTDWASHLDWLNSYLDPLITTQVDLIDEWLRGL